MPNVIPVKLEYSVHELWFDPSGTGAQEGDHVIVQTERGREIGLAVGDAQSLTNDELTLAIGHAQLKNVIRICTDDDLDLADEHARRGDESMPIFRRLVATSGLDDNGKSLIGRKADVKGPLEESFATSWSPAGVKALEIHVE